MVREREPGAERTLEAPPAHGLSVVLRVRLARRQTREPRSNGISIGMYPLADYGVKRPLIHSGSRRLSP